MNSERFSQILRAPLLWFFLGVGLMVFPYGNARQREIALERKLQSVEQELALAKRLEDELSKELAAALLP
jgi:hypothetical protein